MFKVQNNTVPQPTEVPGSTPSQVLKFSAFEPDLKIIITNLIRTLTIKTITYSSNGEATLTENMDSKPGCYVIKISTFLPTQLPFRVTPNSIGDIA